MTITLTEAEIATAIQQEIQKLDQFAEDDVTINDHDVLNGPAINAPFVVIKTTNEFRIDFRVQVAEQLWSIPLELFVAFDDWDISLEEIKEARRYIISAADAGISTVGLTLRAIRNGSDVLPVYRTYVPEGEQADMLPDFLMQEILIDSEVY